MKNITRSISILLIAFSLFGESPLFNNSDIYNLPDFRVSGTLWERTIKDTPESVTLFDNNTIKALNARSFKDLIENTPNLTFTGGTQSPRYFQIRGIGENSQFEGETPDQSVRFLIDDFDFTGIAGITNLFDVKQVEVIRGAQTNAYGVNASAGIIKIKTEEPSLKTENKFALGFGNYDVKNISYASGGPLAESDKTSYRISLSQDISDGFIKNTELNLNNTNRNESLFSLLKIKHKLNYDSYLESSLILAIAENGYDEWSLDNTRHETQSDKPGKDKQTSTGLSFRYTSYNTPNTSFCSVSSYLESDTLYSYDSDWGNFQDNTSGYDGFLEINRDRKSFSQEFRLDSHRYSDNGNYPIEFTIGLHLNHLNEISNILYNENSNWGTELAEVYSDYKTNSISLFGMFNFELSENDNLSLGYRFENQSVNFISKVKNENNYYGMLKSGSASSQEPLMGGSLIYSKIISKNKKLFLSFNRGYRSAGANSSSFRQGNSPLIYKTENIDSYDVGLNFNSNDNSFIGTINLFHIQRHNTQLRDSQGSGGFFNYFTSNSGKARHYGIEYQSIWNFMNVWSFSSSFSLLNARLDNAERELSNSPSDQYSFILSYSPSSGLYSNLSLAISDAYFESNSHNFKRDAYAVWKGSIGYKKGNFDISFWINNIFDQSYTKRIFYFDNGDPDYPSLERKYLIEADPMNYGLSLEYNW